MNTLVSTQWLSSHINDRDLVILDCTVIQEPTEDGSIRNVSGRGHYEQGHIPGAGFADLTGALADGESPLEFAIPTPEAFCDAMVALGVGDNSQVVLYDANLSAWAADPGNPMVIGAQ